MQDGFEERLQTRIEQTMTGEPSYMLVFETPVEHLYESDPDESDRVFGLLVTDQIKGPRNHAEEMWLESTMVAGWPFRMSFWFDTKDICLARSTRFPTLPDEVVRAELEERGFDCTEIERTGQGTSDIEVAGDRVRVNEVAVFPKAIYDKLHFLPAEAAAVIELPADQFRWTDFFSQ